MKQINVKNISFSFHPCPQNYRCLDWGPNGLLAVAFQNFITIYDTKDMTIFRTINLHKANITAMRFSPVTVEKSLPNSFQILLAVGDESGNCIIYDVYTGLRVSGFSPEKGMGISLFDFTWSQTTPSILYILTDIPSIVAVTCGSSNKRHYSFSEVYNQLSSSLQTLNLTILFSIPLNTPFNFIVADQFNEKRFYIVSKSGTYSILQIYEGQQVPLVSSLMTFTDLSQGENIVSVECYPHCINRLTLITNQSIYVYDLITQTSSLLYQNTLVTIPCMHNIFSPNVNDQFWVALNDSTVSRYKIQENNYLRNEYLLIPHFQQMCCFVVDPFKSSRFAVCTQDGKIAVFDNCNGKLMCIGYRPSFPSSVSSMTSDEDQNYAFVTNKGYVGIFNTLNGNIQRYQINIDQTNVSQWSFNSIHFAGRKLAIGCKYLLLLDLERREITIENRYVTPNKLTTLNDVIAYAPFPNSFDIIYPNLPKRSLMFKAIIVLLAPNINNPFLWAFLIKGIGCYIIDTSEQHAKMVTNFTFTDEIATSMLFVDHVIYISTKTGEVYQCDLKSKQTLGLPIRGVHIRSMKWINGFIFISDIEDHSYIIPSDLTKFDGRKTRVYPISNVHFLKPRYIETKQQKQTDNTTNSNNSNSSLDINNSSTTNNNLNNNVDSSNSKESNVDNDSNNVDSSNSKESNVNNDSNNVDGAKKDKRLRGNSISVKPLSSFTSNDDTQNYLEPTLAVVQVTPTTLLVIMLPSYEPCIYPSKISIKNEIINRFYQCKNIDEYEKVALEAGDLDFVQFVRTFQHKGSLPIPALYTQNHNDFVEKERTTRIIERLTQPFNYIDFLILTKDIEHASQLLLSLNTNHHNKVVTKSQSANIHTNSSVGSLPTIENFALKQRRNMSSANNQHPSIAQSKSEHASFLALVTPFKRPPTLTPRGSLPDGKSNLTRFQKLNLKQDDQPINNESSSPRLDGFKEVITNLGISNTAKEDNKEELFVPDETNILLAYACMSPNIDAAKRIAENFINMNAKGKHAQLIAKLLSISGNNDAAINWLTENEDWGTALYYLKILYKNENCISNIDKLQAEVIRNWINERPILILSPLILSYLGEYHAALVLLYNSGNVAKAYLLLKYLIDNEIEIRPSSLSEYNSISVTEIVESIETKWKNNL